MVVECWLVINCEIRPSPCATAAVVKILLNSTRLLIATCRTGAVARLRQALALLPDQNTAVNLGAQSLTGRVRRRIEQGPASAPAGAADRRQRQRTALTKTRLLALHCSALAAFAIMTTSTVTHCSQSAAPAARRHRCCSFRDTVA